MDAEFQTLLVRTLLIGSAIALFGGTLLFLAFRSFGREKGGGIRTLILGMGAIVFILLCCAALFVAA